MASGTPDIWAYAQEFIGVKIVKAARLNLGDYNNYRGWTIPVDENPHSPGYIIQYPDGYISWCPEAQFEEANRQTSGMTFGMATEAVKKGFRIARAGWNGKGLWVSYTPGKTLDMSVHDIWTENVKQLAIENGGKVTLRPYFSMKTVEGELQIGWAPSVSDALADDWYIVK